MKKASEVANLLLQIKAIRLNPQNPFTWASGIQSPIYCDNRIALSHPTVRNQIIDGLVDLTKDFGQIDTVAGVATAGIPHGTLVADRLNLPFIYIRDKAKSHGRKNRIEGYLNSGHKVLVIEDLISTGGSCLTAVEAVREAGGKVAGVAAIFSYELERAQRAFAQNNCTYKTLSTYEVLLEEALKSDYIKKEDLEKLVEWRKNPEGWLAHS